MIKLQTFEERFRYLQLAGSVGIETFGFDRYLNQALYKSQQWKSVRDQVIIRDCGCDLAIEDRPIFGRVIIHHMNPINEYDINNRNEEIFNPEFLVCTTIETHNAIHYGDDSYLDRNRIIERTANDTCPWK